MGYDVVYVTRYSTYRILIKYFKMIVKYLANNYAFDPFHIFDFEPYGDSLKDITLHYGINSEKHINKTDTNKKVLFFVEWPNCLYGKAFHFNIDFINANFDYIFSICPYTNNYLNHRFNTNKYITTFFPTELKGLPDIPPIKDIPVFYTGHNFTEVKAIRMINNILSATISDKEYQLLKAPMTTLSQKSYYEKMKLLGRTKIALVHNTLQSLYNYYKTDPLFNDSTANKYLPWNNDRSNEEVPQIKSRVFEAAVMKCVLLVYKDKYNLIEQYFTEGVHFIYFSSAEEAIALIKDILDNDKYKEMAENAYELTRTKYSTGAFCQFIHDSVEHATAV